MSQNNNIIIFDQKTLTQHQKRAEKMSGDFDFLTTHCQKNLQERLKDIKRDFSRPLDIDSQLRLLKDEQPLILEEEKPDLAISHLTLHWVNDLPGRLLQIQKTLKPDGVFLASLFGGETLYELRQSLMATELDLFGGLSPRVSPFIDMRDMGGLLQRAGFALPVVDHEIIHVTYDHLFNLIADLRGMGLTNTIVNRSKRYLGKNFWAQAHEYYQENFANDQGRLVASFEVIYLIGWAPDASQQQPLKPGSAKRSLAQVLKTNEIALPEKAHPKK